MNDKNIHKTKIIIYNKIRKNGKNTKGDKRLKDRKIIQPDMSLKKGM
ncbi:MAG: hypothetical protein HFJ55_06245 [Clostridia bacterium]|nr:hypothetical protein [Clostridia bacterium]